MKELDEFKNELDIALLKSGLYLKTNSNNNLLELHTSTTSACNLTYIISHEIEKY